MMINLGMVLFFYGLLGPPLNDVGILVLLPSRGSELVLFNHTFKRRAGGGGAASPICKVWIFHLLVPQKFPTYCFCYFIRFCHFSCLEGLRNKRLVLLYLAPCNHEPLCCYVQNELPKMFSHMSEAVKYFCVLYS